MPPISPDRLATYVTWRELNGSQAVTNSDLLGRLQALPRNEVISACAAINVILKTWLGSVDVDEHERLLKLFFSPNYAARLDARAKRRDEPQFVFHRQQLLFLMKQAALHASPTIAVNGQFNEEFATCCLMVNELLPHDRGPESDFPTLELLMPEMVTVNAYSYKEDLVPKCARAKIMFEEMQCNPAIRNRKGFFDIDSAFFSATGLTIRHFSTLIIATLVKYQSLGLEAIIQNRGAFSLSDSFYSSILIPENTRRAFLSQVSQTTDEFSQACGRVDAQNDQKPLQDKPLVVLPSGEYILSDVGFLIDKLDSGVFWQVHNLGLPSKKQKDNFHALWGHVFEHYVDTLLTTTCRNSPNQYLPWPQFEDGAEVADGIILCGKTAILIEAKGSTITAEAKYSGDSSVLIKELMEKFIGTGDKPKGVRQLANSLIRVGSKSAPHRIKDVKTATKIIPLLVARDSTLSSPLVNRWLNEKFGQLFNRKRIKATITPLFVLTIEELEQILPYLIDTRLDEILESRYRKNPAMGMPFGAVQNDVIQSLPPRSGLLVRGRARRVFDEVCMDCFGKHYEGLESGGEPRYQLA
jgi:hypothetical protein